MGSGPSAPEHRACRDRENSRAGILVAVMGEARGLGTLAMGLNYRIAPAYSERGLEILLT